MTMRCLIIAAGKGTRLAHKGDPKPLVRLLGLSLIERVILTAKKCGLTDFYVVTGHKGEMVRSYLDKFSQERNVRISHITNEEWEKENGISVLKAKGVMKENFLLFMSDHVFAESALNRLMEQKIQDGEVLLCVDYQIGDNNLVNLEDATKVRVERDKILDIGKNLRQYNAFDTGLFLCSPAIFEAIEESIQNGDSSLSGGIRVLAACGGAKAVDIGDAFWVDVDDEASSKRAEKKLLSLLKKETDGPISRYLNRPISTRITKFLLNTGISPNEISFVSFLAAVVAAITFSLGGYLLLVIGGLFAQISSIVDGCDGEVARLKFKESRYGAWFDAVLDRYADAFLLFGLTMNAYHPVNALFTLGTGFMAIIGSFINSYTADRYDNVRKRWSQERKFPRLGRDVRIMIIFIGALMNQVLLTLAFIAVIMNLENVRRIRALYLHER